MGVVGAGVGGGIGSAIGGIVGAATQGKSGKGDYKKAIREWEDLLPSQFDERGLDAPYLRELAQMTPEEYDVAQAQGVQGVTDSAGARAAQVSSLAGLEEIGREGMPLADRLAAQDAHRSVMGSAQGARQAMLSNLSARGALSGGDAIQAALAGGQQSANLSRDLGNDMVRQSAMNRLSGLQAAGQAGGELRAGDVNVSAQNAGIANRFAELFSQQQTARNAQNAQTRGAANAYNVQNRQRVGDTNVANKYNTSLENLNRKNSLRGQSFQQGAQRAAGLAGAYTGLGNYRDDQNAAKMQNAQAIGQGVGSTVGALV